MGDGVNVPTGTLHSTADVLKALSTSAEQIEGALKDADPPVMEWGLLGIPMGIIYSMKADDVRDHIRKIAEALDSQSGAVKASATNYDELDTQMHDAFQRFADKLGGKK